MQIECKVRAEFLSAALQCTLSCLVEAHIGSLGKLFARFDRLILVCSEKTLLKWIPYADLGIEAVYTIAFRLCYYRHMQGRRRSFPLAIEETAPEAVHNLAVHGEENPSNHPWSTHRRLLGRAQSELLLA